MAVFQNTRFSWRWTVRLSRRTFLFLVGLLTSTTTNQAASLCEIAPRVLHSEIIFAEEVKRNAKLVTIPEDWKERFLAKIETWEREALVIQQVQIDRLRTELTSIKTKIDRLNLGFTDGSIDIQEFKELKNPLIPRKVELEGQIVAVERNKLNRLEPLRNWILEANRLEKSVSEENWGEMKSFLQNVGSNRLLRAQTLTVSFLKPWDSLAQTKEAVFSTASSDDESAKWWR